MHLACAHAPVLLPQKLRVHAKLCRQSVAGLLGAEREAPPDATVARILLEHVGHLPALLARGTACIGLGAADLHLVVPEATWTVKGELLRGRPRNPAHALFERDFRPTARAARAPRCMLGLHLRAQLLVRMLRQSWVKLVAGAVQDHLTRQGKYHVALAVLADNPAKHNAHGLCAHTPAKQILQAILGAYVGSPPEGQLPLIGQLIQWHRLPLPCARLHCGHCRLC
mmetsp:Transcript_106051/g.329412  ORF Transcript_106051/g.329412 Transcript_106051/m.329412 type:complete len:226 (+) Transcript_106051:1326-2003(+)